MIYPRQRLYDVNFRGFLKCLFLGTFNYLKKNETENQIVKKLKDLFSLHFGYKDIVPLPMGRIACYLAVKNSITNTKKKILICPFTIFDMINMIHLAGGIPQFADSAINSPHMCYEDLKLKIKKDTAAVLITNYHNVNPNLEKIYKFCKLNKIKIIEDCAISIGHRRSNNYPDFAIFSFGLFKFISCFYGGGIYVKSKSIRKSIEHEVKEWPKTGILDVMPAFLKGVKFNFLTKLSIFNIFTFPIFKIGFLNNISFIKKMAVNDPDPFFRKEMSSMMKKRLSIFQLREIIRQIPSVKKNLYLRLYNTKYYHKKLKKSINKGSPNIINIKKDCYLNFPLLVKNKSIYNKLMKNNFDASKYYYRNCADLEIFSRYSKNKLNNLNNYVDQVIILPNYSSLPKKYLDKLIKFLNININF